MNDIRILLTEDEKTLRETVKLNLELEGYEVVEAKDGLEALKKIDNQRFNLLVLDVMMPNVDGFGVCERVRVQNNNIPILFLTAKNEGKDKIKGLKLGADDYLTKPFNLEEFLLRVKILIKHSLKNDTKNPLGNEYQFGDNKINFDIFEAINFKGEKINLTKKEVDLLRLFSEKNNEVVSRQHILQNVWGYDVFPSTRTIDNFILAFRKYFETNPKSPKHFISVRGVGYKFMND